MTKLVLVRHGETDWNVAEIFRGRLDVELNETGRRQAEQLGQYLADREITSIFSSPLKRATETAEIVARKHHLKVEVAPELNDYHFGEWQGLSHQQVREKYPELFGEWLKNPQLVTVPGGESLGDVRKRVLGLVDKVVSRGEGTCLLVSHRVVNKVLICALLSLDNTHFWNIRLDTCGLTTFTYEEERFILTRHNDTSFLKSPHQDLLPDF